MIQNALQNWSILKMVQNDLQNWILTKCILTHFKMEIDMKIEKWPIQTNLSHFG